MGAGTTMLSTGPCLLASRLSPMQRCTHGATTEQREESPCRAATIFHRIHHAIQIKHFKAADFVASVFLSTPS